MPDITHMPMGRHRHQLDSIDARVVAGLVSVPNRYMHSAVEMIALDDTDQSAKLLARFAASIKADADFTP